MIKPSKVRRPKVIGDAKEAEALLASAGRALGKKGKKEWRPVAPAIPKGDKK